MVGKRVHMYPWADAGNRAWRMPCLACTAGRVAHRHVRQAASLTIIIRFAGLQLTGPPMGVCGPGGRGLSFAPLLKLGHRMLLPILMNV